MYKNLARTLFVGKNMVFLTSCHSTNQIAYDNVSKRSLPEGTIFITDHQKNGRGQMGNTWEAAPGKNLTFTLVLSPSFVPVRDQFDLNRIVSLALTDYLSRLSSGFTIKWPNDIFYQGQKLGGILIQNILRDRKIDYSLIGIGLNINQKSFLVPNAASLTRILNKSFNLAEVLEELADSIEFRYLQLRNGRVDRIREDYLSRLYRLGEEHLFQSMEQGLFKGSIQTVDTDGTLIMACPDGLRHFQFKEVEYIY